MPACKICASADRESIEAHIRPVSALAVARRYRVPVDSVYRHKKNHMAPVRLPDPVAAEPVRAPEPEPVIYRKLTEWEEHCLGMLGYTLLDMAEMSREEGVRIIGEGRRKERAEPGVYWDEETAEKRL